MSYTFSELTKMQRLQTDKEIFVFNKKTQDLEFVDLSKNENLKEIRFDSPQENLRYIDASNCHIENVIFSQECKNLQTIYLHHNNLQQIEFNVELPELELIDLSFNEKLTELNIEGDLLKLKLLYLHKCDFNNLQNLSKYFVQPGFDFNIEENPLVEPPESIVKQGKDTVQRYFESILKQGKDYIYEAKLLILGDPRAGKTALTRKILDINAELPKEDETTRGIDIKKWSFKHHFSGKGEKDVAINIWDFGGQTIYKQTHRFFLTQRSLYIILSDGGSSEITDFRYWLYSAKIFGKNSPVIIFINEKEYRKFDLPFETFLKINSQLKNHTAVNLKDVNGKDKDRFDKALDLFKSQLVSLPHLGEPVPASWKKIREKLSEIEKKVIYKDEYNKICEDEQVKDEETQNDLAQYFHDIGVFLHFQDNEILQKYIFINKQWILNGAYIVIDSKTVSDVNGKLSKNDFYKLFSDEYSNYQLEIKELLKVFYLIYEKDGYYVVPQHLPKDPVKYNWDRTNNVRFIFEYEDYMPAGILWQLIVEMNGQIKNDKVWRYGVILDFKGTEVEIIEEYGKDIIKISVVGSNKEDIRAVIINKIEEINHKYDKLPVSRLVPCVCDSCKDNEKPFIFKYDELKKLKRSKIEDDRCKESLKMVSVSKLLQGVDFRENKHTTEINDLTILKETPLSNIDFVSKKELKKVLMIFSTPKSEQSIRFGDEIKIVTDKLEHGKIYTLEKTKFKVENTEIIPLIKTVGSNIVHFSLHGQKNKGLIFTDKKDEKVIVDIHEFEMWLNLLSGIKINCFIFNACHSAEFAKLASNYADYAIGMNDLILEPHTALLFSENFYSILEVEDNIENAFKSSIISLYNKREKLKTRDSKIQHEIPELYKNGELILNFNLMQRK